MRASASVGWLQRLSPATAATLALVGVTAAWGSTFVLVKDAVARMPVMDFLTLRFGLAAAVMLVLRPRATARLGSSGWRAGALLGLALGAGYVAQTAGLQYTTATVSGFITGMFVVFTPVVAAVVLRRPAGPAAWVGVGLATVGLAVLSLRGFALGFGETLTLLCALLFAVHIVGLGEWAPRHDSYALAVVQLATVALACALIAAPGGLTAPPDLTAWMAVLVTAVFATAVAFVAQTWAQARLSATRAAVVMTMEPVFAGIFGVLVGGDELGARTMIGAALVLTAMYVVELSPRRRKAPPVERLES